jgi:hypothetical protein
LIPAVGSELKRFEHAAKIGNPCPFCESAVTQSSQLTDLIEDGAACLMRTMQFTRVITPVEDIQIWNASSNGFSFVISYESRSGSGLQGNPGFLASWRPIYQNRPAVKVIGSPFKTLAGAEQACDVMLGHLISDTPSLPSLSCSS